VCGLGQGQEPRRAGGDAHHGVVNMPEPDRFISEDTTESFEGWFKNRNFGPITPEQETILRKHYDEMKKCAPAKVGLMKLPPPAPSERRYAVACRDSTDLWLTLWVRRSPKGEFFVMVPRGDREWDPHISYHLNGKFRCFATGDRASAVYCLLASTAAAARRAKLLAQTRAIC
jgi:hypothetical protein